MMLTVNRFRVVNRSIFMAPAFNAPQTKDTAITPRGLFPATRAIIIPSHPMLLLKLVLNRPYEPETSIPPHSPDINPDIKNT